MPFPRRLLNDYETVALDLHPHWWYWGSSALTLAGMLVLSLFVNANVPEGLGKDIVTYMLMAGILVSAGWLVVNLVKWRTTYFVVTSHRLIYRQGVVARQGVEIPLERVNNVNFNQSIFERILQVGDLLIESGGTDGQQSFTDIAQPEVVQNIIHSVIRTRLASRGENETGSGASVAGELERLEALRDRGTLTEDEFEEQKRRILER